MKYHAFNLSRLEVVQDNKVIEEEGFWTIRNAAAAAGLIGFSFGGIAFVLWARRPFKG